MLEPETFIVTVRAAGIELDMELPSVMSFGELKEKILDILKSLYSEEFETWTECILINKNRRLKNDNTLIEAGIFDGGYLDVIKV